MQDQTDTFNRQEVEIRFGSTSEEIMAAAFSEGRQIGPAVYITKETGSDYVACTGQSVQELLSSAAKDALDRRWIM